MALSSGSPGQNRTPAKIFSSSLMCKASFTALKHNGVRMSAQDTSDARKPGTTGTPNDRRISANREILVEGKKAVSTPRRILFA